MIQPTQVTTPLPLNATDEDLLNGDHLINRPPSEFTPVSTLLVAVQIARVIQEVFAHVDSNPTGSTYAYVLELDRQLRNVSFSPSFSFERKLTFSTSSRFSLTSPTGSSRTPTLRICRRTSHG